MTEQKTLWAVYTNDDLTEGRGRQYVKYFCECEATANRLAKRGYVQGTDCPVEPVKAFVMDGVHVLPTSLIKVEQPTKEDVQQEERIAQRRAAMAKAKESGLSDAEIALIAGRPS